VLIIYAIPLDIQDFFFFRRNFIDFYHKFMGKAAYLLTNERMARFRVLKKLTGSQLVKKFPAFDGTRTFTTTFTISRKLSLFVARPNHSISQNNLLKIHFNITVPCMRFLCTVCDVSCVLCATFPVFCVRRFLCSVRHVSFLNRIFNITFMDRTFCIQNTALICFLSVQCLTKSNINKNKKE
jgi:hypothetical protein